MNQTKKDEFGNDIFWYALGDEVDEWVRSLQDVFNPVPLDRFATSVKRDLETHYDFTKSQLDFVSEQFDDADVVKALFERYLDRLPKFSGKCIACCPELIWGAGETEKDCIADAKYWLAGGLTTSLSEADVELYEASDRAYEVVKEHGADASHHIVEVYQYPGSRKQYCHVAEVPATVR